MDVTGLNEVGNAANSTANGANAATTATTSTASATTSTTAATTTSTATATTTSTTVAASNPGVYMQAGKALAESAISTVSSTAAQASVKGISFSDAIKEQGTNILVGAVANVGAKHIGVNYKTSGQTGVDKAIQLTSHAALGAGVSALTGNDALSGAVSGVIGEVVGEASIKHLNQNQADKQGGIITLAQIRQNKNIAKELSGVAGAYSSIFTGNLVGNSDSEIADNMWSGQRIGKNAAEHNALANIGGAIAGGTIGGVGAGVSAIIGGEKDIKNIGKAVLIGSSIGAASGAIFSPAGVMKGIAVGGLIGATGGGLEGYVTELSTNSNTTNYDLLNSSLKGALSGAVGGSVAGAFGGAIGPSVGISGGYAAGMIGLGAGVSTSAINTKYNFFEPQLNSSKIQTNNKPIN